MKAVTKWQNWSCTGGRARLHTALVKRCGARCRCSKCFTGGTAGSSYLKAFTADSPAFSASMHYKCPFRIALIESNASLLSVTARAVHECLASSKQAQVFRDVAAALAPGTLRQRRFHVHVRAMVTVNVS